MIRYLPRLSSHKFFYSVIVVCLVVICIPSAYVGNQYRLKKKYERALSRIQIGDSEQSVVSLMGQPDERYWCTPLRTNHDSPEQKQFHERCVQEYWYVTFLEPYIVTFDKNNRVSGKQTMVSP